MRLLKALLTAGDVHYGLRLQDLEAALQGQVEHDEAIQKKRVHWALVQGVRLKRTIAEVLRLSNRCPFAIHDSPSGTQTTCPVRNAEIFAYCL